jgi:hypothetical protein
MPGRCMLPRLRGMRMLLSLLIVFSFSLVSRGQAVNVVDITMISYDYNCSTGMATVKYHITNTDEAGHVGGYGTSYTINLGVYSTSGYINNGDDDMEFTGGYIIGDIINIRARGAGNNFSYDRTFDYQGYLPKPGAPDIWINSPIQICNGQSTTLTASGSNGNYLWSNGETGASITVSTAGTYTVQAVSTNGCGNSDPSNAIVVNVGGSTAAPVIAASPATTLCNGGSATLFTYSNSGGVLHWSNGDVGATTVISSPGTYYAYEVTSCGTSPNSNSVVIIAVNTNDVPTISSSNGTTLCNGATTTLTAVSAHGGPIYWSTGETGNSITVSSAGSYNAYEGTDCGTSNYSNTITITTLSTPAAPNIATNQNTQLCDGAVSTLFVPSPNGSVTWNTGATGSSYATSNAGSYYAYQSNACGTSGNSNAITLTTSNSPATPYIIPVGPLQVCNGSTVTLSVSGGGNTNWFKDGGLIAANSGTLVVSAAGSYTATLNNSCGISAMGNTVIVTSGSSPVAPTITSSGTIICNGAPVGLSISASSGGTIHWNNGQTNAAIGVTTPGTYYAYESNGCGNSGNSNVITLSAASSPGAPSLNVTGSITLCNGASQIISTSPTSGGSIHWNTGAAGNSITVNTAGSYYAFETNGCGSGANSAVVNISTLSSPVAPTVTPPGSQLLCNGQTVSFNASGSSITWSNGATGNNMVTGVAGTYYAYDHNVCGNSGNSNSVVIATGNCPTPSPGTSFFICPGSLKTLDAGAGYDTYAWSNGATTRTIAVGPGNYAVTVTKNGCTATSVTVSVSNYSVSVPTINASGPLTFCAGNSIILSSSPASAYAWSNGSTSNSINVTSSGSFYVTITDGNGCQATSVSTTVIVNPLPTASIGGTTSVCKNASAPSIVFNANGGTAPYTFSYTINGGSTQTITSAAGSISVSVPTATAGSFVYNLLGVRESSSTACFNSVTGSATVTVNELPTAAISGSTTVCLNTGSPLLSFTGSTGIAPYTFTYSINGGAAQTVTTTSGNSVSVAVPTTTAGTYTYSLIGVQESSGLTCYNPVTGSATVIIRPLPVASIAGNTTVCANGSSPSITFTGSVGTAPYTFTYNINGGAAQTVTTASGNSVSVAVPTASAGNYTYSLVSVQESGTGTCVNAASGSATVVVNPLPLATIGGSVTVCQNSTQPAITFTGSNATAPYTFTYKINGGANLTVTTVSGNSVTVNVPTDIAGTYLYELVSVHESSGTTCINSVSGSATVVVRPLPTATVAGSTAVCMNSANPLITFTGSVGTAPYIFTYNINGGANQTVTTTAGNSVTVAVPTSSAGTFIYSLAGVQESGSPSCMNAVSGSATIVVNPLPAAAIAGSTTVCQNSATPLIMFTGRNATAPYTFTYSINGGAAQTVTTTSGNSINVPVPTNNPGTFTYSLISVKESSGTTCSNAASGSAIVVINPQPVAAVLLAPTTHLCNGETGKLTIYNWTEGFTYTWYKDGVLLTISSAQTLAVTAAGSYTVMVTSNLGCDAATISNAVIITTGSISTPIITGYLKVCEGGKTKLVISATDQSKPYELYRWTDTPIGDTVAWDKSFSAFAGQYRVSVYRDGCYDSASVIVTANDTEFPAGELMIFPKQIPYGGQATLMAKVTGAASYEWDLGDSRKAVTFSNKMVENYFTRADSVTVKVRAVSERNCPTDFVAMLKVGRPDSAVLTDHSWTGNLKDWNVFPVPFHNELKLSVILRRAENFRVDLFTGDGSWIRSWQFKGIKGENLFALDRVAELPAGVLYFITATYNGEKHFDKIYKY